jgi:hypothetical protein
MGAVRRMRAPLSLPIKCGGFCSRVWCIGSNGMSDAQHVRSGIPTSIRKIDRMKRLVEGFTMHGPPV